MNEDAKHLRKPVAFSAISNYTLETVEVVDELARDGRTDLLEERPAEAGGLGYYAARGVRMFDLDVDVAVGGLIGGLDQREAVDRVQRLGALTRYLIPVPRKFTNRSRVTLDRSGQRQIVRLKHEITFEQDITPERRRWLLGLVAQSQASLLGNLPHELTGQAIEFGRRVGTYMGLAAGARQLAQLDDLCPHALFLNFDEARQATGLRTDDDAGRVFESLLGITKADHVVVMTGGGSRPTHIAERQSGRQWKLNPLELQGIPKRSDCINSLGPGDVLAGVVTFLLAMPRAIVAGDAVFEAVGFGQEVATAHLTGSSWAAKQVRTRYAEIRPLFEAEKPAAARAEEAA